MQIKIECENTKCHNTITGDDIVYCEDCYDNLLIKCEELEDKVGELKDRIDTLMERKE